MRYRIAADTVMVLHLAFIVFIAAGPLLAWRWPRLVWAHLPALAWGVGTVLIGFQCPLTALEKGLRRLGGLEGYDGGFVDNYIEGVIYPEEYTFVLRALAAVLIVAGYAVLGRRRVNATGSERASAGARLPPTSTTPAGVP